MTHKLSNAIILIALALLQFLGTFLFLRGFLLTRHTLPDRGQPLDPWQAFPILPSPVDRARVPFHQGTAYPAMERAVIVVIDALRFDFVVDQKNATRHYWNHLPVIHQLTQSQPTSSLLFQFRADPPTTTMQRVKGLMTGSLPTFIDAGSNFASGAVGEDHLVHHFHSNAFHVTLLGDDTWVHLFPESIDTAHASDSFKMFDLHTVDNRILDKLWTEVAQPRKQVVVAHFLGVDHCGHTYGPDHPHMADKLAQMNTVLERLVREIDDTTLLVVMGDHGMSVEGDHGGESVEELMSTLFLHAKRPLTSADTGLRDLYHRIHAARQRVLGYDLRDISERLHYDASRYPIVSQIHLVPTLAYLMGVPIPFGNLGALLPDVLNPPTIGADPLKTLQHMVLQYRKNAVQVHTYLTRYAAYDAAFAPDALHDKMAYLWAAETALLHSDAAQSRAVLEQAIFDYDAFLIHTLQYCEAIWAQFDVASMVLGIAVLACGVLVSFWLLSSTITRDMFWLVAGLLVQALTLGSNSFVVWEDQGTRFVAATLCVVWLVQDPHWLPLAVLAWIRLTGLTGLCREEQFPYCDSLQTAPDWLLTGTAVVLTLLLLPYAFGRRPTRVLYRVILSIVLVRLVVDVYAWEGSSALLQVYLPRTVFAITLWMTFQDGWCALYGWSAMLAMLQRPLGCLWLLTVPLVVEVLARGNARSRTTRLVLVHTLGSHLFFATFHQATFSALPWKAAFIGFDDMNYYGGATLVSLSTLGSYLLSWMGWRLLLPAPQAPHYDYLLLLSQSIPTALTAVFVYILRRHLMTWKIFAPRLLLQVILGLGVHVMALLIKK